MTGTDCDLFTHKSSQSYLNHLVISLNIKVFWDAILYSGREVSRFRIKILLSSSGKINKAGKFRTIGKWG
jgi:hypothetical protein